MVTFFVLLGLSIVAPILPEYASEFHVNYTLVGLVVSAFAIARMFFDLPTGFLARQYNKKIILIIGLSLVSSSSILAGFAPNYIVLFIARIIEGMGSAIYVTTASVYLAQIATPERRGSLMSVYFGFLLLGTIFGPTLGGFVASSWGIRAPFHVYAILTAIGIIPTLILPTVPNMNKESSLKLKDFFHGAFNTLKDYNFLLVLPAIFATFFLRTGVRSTLVPLYGTTNVGLSESDIGILLTFSGLATAATMVPIGKISDRIGRKNPLLLSLFFTAPFVIWIPFISKFSTFSIAMLLYGAFTGLSGPMTAYITDISNSDKIELYMGMYRLIGDIGFVIGPLLLGLIADYTTIPIMIGTIKVDLVSWIPFLIASIVLIVSALILIKAPNPKPSERLNK
ncbi:MAG: MFS transporter [Candidatus Lokiarchaeota archaeon]